jgi:hypothetical protein
MTEADGLRGYVNELLNQATKAVGNGAAAMEELNKGLGFLKLARAELTGSRVYALQLLETVTTLVNMSESILHSSNNIDVLSAVTNFESARQKVEDYINRIAGAIDGLNMFIDTIEAKRRDQELDASGVFIRSAVESLENYRNTVL